MLDRILQLASPVAKWANENEGIITLAIFVFTLLFGWITGIFGALRNKPKFRLGLIQGPTFSCTFKIGKQCDGYEMHRTAIALYLQIANVGSTPSSIENIAVGYHWNLRPFSFQWLRYAVGWFWIEGQAIALQDFQSAIGDSTRVYPFLLQKSIFSDDSPETYLGAGRSTSGVAYFEQNDSWGGCFPREKEGMVAIKVAVTDVFGRRHVRRFRIPAVSLEQARRYNPSFGKTHAEMRQETLPFDAKSVAIL